MALGMATAGSVRAQDDAQMRQDAEQLHAAAERGWLDLARCRHESLLSIKRAGADMILTYFAKDIAEALRG